MTEAEKKKILAKANPDDLVFGEEFYFEKLALMKLRTAWDFNLLTPMDLVVRRRHRL